MGTESQHSALDEVLGFVSLVKIDSRANGLPVSNYDLHRIIYSLFDSFEEKNMFSSVCNSTPQKMGRILFSENTTTEDCQNRSVILLSPEKPMPQKNFSGTIQTKELCRSFLGYDKYNFSLLVNPTKCESLTKKRKAISGEENVKNWFIKKSDDFGISVKKENLEVRSMPSQKIEKPDETIIHYHRVKILGTLAVSDRGSFVRTVLQGVGRGRSFGLGLMQVIPYKN